MGDKLKELVVVSLFYGISCGLQALKNLGFKNIKYFASEIEPNAIKVSEKNHPEIIRLGDVRSVKIKNGYIESENGWWQLGDDNYNQKIDLIFAGSPCQGFSFAGHQLNFDDPRSSLFFEFIRIKKEIEMYQGNTFDFLLENVKMKEQYEDVITDYLKTWPVKVNSKAFTAQNRERYYWSSLLPTLVYGDADIKDIPNSPHITSILEDDDYVGVWTWPRGYNKGGTRFVDKMPCITTSSWQHNFLVEKQDGTRRKFTPVECERAQGLPDNYTQGISDNQRYKVLGNGWTVSVIEKILSNMVSHKDIQFYRAHASLHNEFTNQPNRLNHEPEQTEASNLL